MLKSERITLLVIPEAGGRTYELKVPRTVVVLAVITAVAIVLLLATGLHYYLVSKESAYAIARLQRANALLEDEVAQIEQLEQILLRVQRSNQQLRAILGESAMAASEPQRVRGGGRYESKVGALERLRWGHVRTYPGLWPVDGVVTRGFSPHHLGVVIHVPRGTLVRASAEGQVQETAYDADLGHQVIIDHGAGIVTQYGHVSQLLVEAGEYVEKGQPIALSGASGTATSPCLFFAVRENGKPTDPQRLRLWL